MRNACCACCAGVARRKVISREQIRRNRPIFSRLKSGALWCAEQLAASLGLMPASVLLRFVNGGFDLLLDFEGSVDGLPGAAGAGFIGGADLDRA